MSSPCIFCRIAARDVPATLVHEDDEIVAFRDLSPQAPSHILVIPRRHVASLDETSDADVQLLGRLLLVAKTVAGRDALSAGYRVVSNIGPAAGQTVAHFHLHVLGGRPMSWPPG